MRVRALLRTKRSQETHVVNPNDSKKRIILTPQSAFRLLDMSLALWLSACGGRAPVFVSMVRHATSQIVF